MKATGKSEEEKTNDLEDGEQNGAWKVKRASGSQKPAHRGPVSHRQELGLIRSVGE